MSKPSLLYIVTTIDSPGGTERTIINQANTAAANGHSTRIISVYGSPDLGSFRIEAAVQVTRLIGLQSISSDNSLLGISERIINYMPSILVPFEWDDQFCSESDTALRAELKGCTEDIVISSTPALTALASEFLPESCILICQEHRPTIYSGKNRIAPLVIHGPRIDRLVSLTNKSTEDISKSIISRSHVALETIPNAVPDSEYGSSPLTNKVIMASGRLVHSKGFEFLISSARYIADYHPDWTFRIFGDGSKKDALLKQIHAARLSKTVDLPGHSDNMSAEYKNASIFALSSRYEAQGLVVLEAMSAGLPVVSYDCHYGPRDMIQDGAQGFLVRPGEIRTFAERLSFLIKNPDIRTAFGRAAQEKATMFSNQKIYAKWVRLFNDLLAERKAISSRSARAMARLRHNLSIASKSQSFKNSIRIATPTEASHELLSKVAKAMHANNIPFFVVPPAPDWDHKWHVIIGKVHRSNFLKSYSEVEWSDMTFRFYYTDSPGQGLIFSPTAHLETLTNRIQNIFKISISYLSNGPENSGITLHYSDVLVEFWNDDENRTHLHKTSNNPYLPSFDLADINKLDSLKLRKTTAPVFGINKTAPWWKCRFPIDIVYTWVDGDDLAFRKNKARYLSELQGRAYDGIGNSNDWDEHRFRSRDELRYSLRSVNAYMPWARRIYIVTNGQVPKWLNTEAFGEKLTLVNHKDIFSKPEHLPTFNSHAIEANLHRIKGLSEKFIYINDDVFVGSPQYPENFFLPNGSTRFFPSSTMVDSIFEKDQAYVKASLNSNLILKDSFGLEPTNSMLHVPHALDRTILAEISERHAIELERTSSARFRSDADLNLVSFLYHYYAYANGKAVPSKTRSRYIGLGASNCGQQLINTISAAFDFLCLGDAPEVSRDTNLDLEQAMKQLFPWASPWEVD